VSAMRRLKHKGNACLGTQSEADKQEKLLPISGTERIVTAWYSGPKGGGIKRGSLTRGLASARTLSGGLLIQV
jgi:hypothetical protein